MGQQTFNDGGSKSELSPSRPAKAAIRLSRRMLAALELLLDAFRYADDLQTAMTDYAVELETLIELGVTAIDLRWLDDKKYLESLPGHPDYSRVNFWWPKQAPDSPLARVYLNAAGVRFAMQMLDPARSGEYPIETPRSDIASPSWNACRRELMFGGLLIKRFRVPAPNQQLVLESFEEEGWPLHILDPLPPTHEIDPKRRLHDTIIALNRGQHSAGLRFTGDGTGNGICWEARR